MLEPVLAELKRMIYLVKPSQVVYLKYREKGFVIPVLGMDREGRIDPEMKEK